MIAALDLDRLRTDAVSDGDARDVLIDYLAESGDVAGLRGQAAHSERARLMLSDHWAAVGREDVARLWRDELPTRNHRTRKRVDKMTENESAQMPAWAEKWIKIGLCTERADRPLFEAAVSACYRYSGLTAPQRIVWAPCPIVVAWAGPIAAHRLATHGDSVRASVRASVGDSVGDSVHDSVGASVRADWWKYFGGQFWAGSGWYYRWGPSSISFALDVLRLDIGRDQELKARAYAATVESACWWWPHTDFVIVSERPTLIDKHGNDKLKIARWEWVDADGKAQSWEVRP